MLIPFTKMHGTGNDYIYIDITKNKIAKPAETAAMLSDRHYGIGADGLVLIDNSEIADFKMIMYNSDGSKSEMCGNAIRCVAKYIYDNKMVSSKNMTIETEAGIKKLEIVDIDKKDNYIVKVNMGPAIWECNLIPIKDGYTNDISIEFNSTNTEIIALSMGNPHAVIFTNEITDNDFNFLGPAISENPIFPNKVNVEFAIIKDYESIDVRVWERGTGETLACGTGACAVFAAARRSKLVNTSCNIKLRGGNLIVSEHDKDIFMTGEAKTIFQGTIEL